MSLLVNPGFESGEAPWTFLTGSSLVTDGSGRGGGNCARIAATRVRTNLPPAPPIYSTVEGEVYQVPEWELGTVYVVSGYAKPETAWGPLTIHCGPNTVASWPIDAATDWTPRYGLYYAGTPEAEISIQAALGEATGYSSWLVDDLSLTTGGLPMARCLYNCYAALFDKLKDINGSTGGYHNSISAQVVPRLVLPSEPGAPKMPYICLPLSDTGAYEGSQRGIRIALRQPIVGFVPESESNDIADCSPTRALKFHDDIVRCLMPVEPATVWNLGNADVEDVELVAKEVVAGQNDGVPWSEVNVTVDVFTRFSRSDLGTS